MTNGLLGRKLGMTQIFTERDERLVPVTVVEAGPCIVTQLKTPEKDGYSAVQIGYGEAKEKHLNRPLKGHFDKAKVIPQKHLVEILVDNPNEFEVGQNLTVEAFSVGERTDIISLSKGKGFTGVVKRWGFRGGPGSHGAHFHRAPGSIGACATPSRVFKGKKLPGHHGNKQVTVKNLEVMKVDLEQNLLLLKGAVPGGKDSLLVIKKTRPQGG